jgi:hypothetical protein
LLVAQLHVLVPRVAWLLPAGRSGPQFLVHEGVTPEVHGVTLSCSPGGHAPADPPSDPLSEPLLDPLELPDEPPDPLEEPLPDPLELVPLELPLLDPLELPLLDPLPPLETPELDDCVPGLLLVPQPDAGTPAASSAPAQIALSALILMMHSSVTARPACDDPHFVFHFARTCSAASDAIVTLADYS